MLILLTALALASDPDPFATDAAVHTLPNGLTVVVEGRHRTDQVALHLRVAVGSRDEQDGQRGLAHLFEHLMFEGSEHAPGNAYDTLLTAAGGENNAFTSEDETAYHAVFPSGALERVLFLESDRLGHLQAGLTEESVSNQIDVVLRERQQDQAAPHGRDIDTLTHLLYPPGHPYHFAVIGTVHDVQSFTVQGAVDFHTRWYRPDGAVLAIVGHVDPQAALERVAHWFSDVPAGAGPIVSAHGDLPPTTAGGAYVLEDHVGDFTVNLAWSGVAELHADEAALVMASFILSDGRGTRLDQQYYRKGWVTETTAQSWSGALDGFVLLSGATDRPGKVEALARRLRRTLEGLVRRPPTDQELSRARQRVRSLILNSLELPADRAEVLADCMATRGRPDCAGLDWQRVQAVTSQDVVAAVARALERPPLRLDVVPYGTDPGERQGVEALP